MPTAAAKFESARHIEISNNSAAQWAGLFSPDAEVRAQAIAEIARGGETAVPRLGQIVQRPLGYALDCWPEWQEMLPTDAILARCKFAQQSALQAMGLIGRPAIGELTKLLKVRDSRMCELAGDALRQMDTPEAVAALHCVLEQELARSRYAKREWHVIAFTSFGIVCGLLFLMPIPGGVARVLAGCALFCGWLAWLMLVMPKRAAGVRQTAIAALTQSGNKQHIGILTNCLDDPNPDVRQSASEALTQLLPQVRIQDKLQISRKEQTALLRALDGDNPDLAVAVLGAMQHIGDEHILRQVAYVIDSPVHHAIVREAAHECLPQVKQRVREAQEAQILLRSASKQKEGAACLLRPLREQTVSEHEEQLLLPR